MFRSIVEAAAAALLCCACAAPAWAQKSRAPGEVFQDVLAGGGLGPELVVVPAGSFVMGSDAPRGDGPPHVVEIAAPFAIGRFEVMRGEFAGFARAAELPELADCPDLYAADRYAAPLGSWSRLSFDQSDGEPVVCITRADAQAFLDWLSFETGARYRLPSEAEWEYAARAGTTTEYANGDDLSQICAAGNLWDRTAAETSTMPTLACTDGYARTAPVGSFPPNAFGLYDMIGNAGEMTEDCFFETHDGAPADGSARAAPDCFDYVQRGGAWDMEADPSTAHRITYYPDRQDESLGFRVLRELP